MKNNNTYVGNITKQGKKEHGKLTTFSISVYNGKDEPPFFIKVKCFPQTDMKATLEPKNRVAIIGNLRMDRWKKEGETIEVLTVNADKVSNAPWEGGKTSGPAAQDALDDNVPF